MHDSRDLAAKDASAHISRLRAQGLAFAAIKGFSILTILLLGLIIGFILVKGLRYSNQVRSSYLSHAERAPDGLAVAVNDATRLKSIDFSVLYGIFTDEYINWSKINADDHDLTPIAVDASTPEGRASDALLFGPLPGGVSMRGALVATVPNVAAAIAALRSTPGSIAILPAASISGVEGIAAVPLRRLVLALNPQATELVDNRSLEDLNDTRLRELVAGAIPNWKKLGGPDLNVRLLAPPAGSSLAAVATAAGRTAISGGGSGSYAPETGSVEEYAAAIASTPGAAGYLFGAQAMAAGLPTATRGYVESGWNLNLDYLIQEPRLSGRVGGISTIVANTFLMLLVTILLAAPIGVAAAVYLIEYAKQGFLIKILRLGTETLAGIPSIIFGLFGMLFFVDILGFGFGLLSGCLTLSLMILPTIVRTSEEALKSVPGGLREGSLALGATKLQTIFRVVLPAAAPGVLTGLILGIGRALGETAALLFTMGSDYKLAAGLFSSARALSSHIYLLFAEGISFDRAFSTATVLIALVLAFNFAAKRLIGRMGRFNVNY